VQGLYQQNEKGQKMSNEFDLEWAKLGGAVYAEFELGYSDATHANETDGGNVYFYDRRRDLFVVADRQKHDHTFSFYHKCTTHRLVDRVTSHFSSDCVELRMATRAECEAAGVEYI
jgi:hypothetical protein